MAFFAVLHRTVRRDERAATVVAEMRIGRVVDRLDTGARVAEAMVGEMWREESEEEEEEESLSLKKRVLVTIACIRQNIEKLQNQEGWATRVAEIVKTSCG